MVGVESISMIQTAIFWRSSPVRMAAVVRRRPGFTPCLHRQRVARAIEMLTIDGVSEEELPLHKVEIIMGALSETAVRHDDEFG
jgi:hypothetical protein